jgi:hypothetical protein
MQKFISLSNDRIGVIEYRITPSTITRNEFNTYMANDNRRVRSFPTRNEIDGLTIYNKWEPENICTTSFGVGDLVAINTAHVELLKERHEQMTEEEMIEFFSNH